MKKIYIFILILFIPGFVYGKENSIKVIDVKNIDSTKKMDMRIYNGLKVYQQKKIFKILDVHENLTGSSDLHFYEQTIIVQEGYVLEFKDSLGNRIKTNGKKTRFIITLRKKKTILYLHYGNIEVKTRKHKLDIHVKGIQVYRINGIVTVEEKKVINRKPIRVLLKKGSALYVRNISYYIKRKKYDRFIESSQLKRGKTIYLSNKNTKRQYSFFDLDIAIEKLRLKMRKQRHVKDLNILLSSKFNLSRLYSLDKNKRKSIEICNEVINKYSRKENSFWIMVFHHQLAICHNYRYKTLLLLRKAYEISQEYNYNGFMLSLNHYEMAQYFNYTRQEIAALKYFKKFIRETEKLQYYTQLPALASLHISSIYVTMDMINGRDWSSKSNEKKDHKMTLKDKMLMADLYVKKSLHYYKKAEFDKIKIINDFFRFGRFYNRYRRNDRALFYYTSLEANFILSAKQKKRLGYIFGKAGINYYRINEYDKAIVCYKKSIHLLEKLPDSSKVVAVNSGNIGTVYFYKKNYNLALKYYKKSKKIYKKIKYQGYNSSLIFLKLGHVYSRKKNFIMALDQYKKAVSELPRYNSDENISYKTLILIGQAYYKMGKIESNIKKYENSLKHFNNAIATYRKIYNHKERRIRIAFVHFRLGKMLYEKALHNDSINDYELSKKYFLRALYIFKEYERYDKYNMKISRYLRRINSKIKNKILM